MSTNEKKEINGNAIPVRGNDIDTDRIIPARFLKCVTFDGLGEYVFQDDRLQEKEKGNTHPFDNSNYENAKIMVVNKNFGCGSSREHAPQSILRAGVNIIIGESFAEIFFGNCVALGIPCFTVSEETASKLQSLIEEKPTTKFKVDVASKSITDDQENISSLGMSSSVQKQFLDGSWNITGILLSHLNDVKKTAAKLPYTSWSAV